MRATIADSSAIKTLASADAVSSREIFESASAAAAVRSPVRAVLMQFATKCQLSPERGWSSEMEKVGALVKKSRKAEAVRSTHPI
ncbi:MAG: hypothetical protein WA418_16390 [Bradyrhizobium sp.]